MDTNKPTPSLALIEEIKAQKRLRGFSTKRLVQASGVPKGTLDRMFSSDPREVGMAQIAALAAAFGMRPGDLVALADARLVEMSAAAGTTDELAERRRKQDDAARMTPEDLERLESAATRDRELDTDEPDPV